MQKPEDSFDSENSEAQLEGALLQPLRDYANGPEIKISEATDVFILSEARQRLNKETVAPMGRAHQFPFRMVAGLAAAFVVFLGLTFAIWPKQQPSGSGLQLSQNPTHAVDQSFEPSDIQDTRDLEKHQASGNIPVIASFVAPDTPIELSDFSGSIAPKTDETLSQLTGNIYSM